jgi:hypothetical protein
MSDKKESDTPEVDGYLKLLEHNMGSELKISPWQKFELIVEAARRIERTRGKLAEQYALLQATNNTITDMFREVVSHQMVVFEERLEEAGGAEMIVVYRLAPGEEAPLQRLSAASRMCEAIGAAAMIVHARDGEEAAKERASAAIEKAKGDGHAQG